MIFKKKLWKSRHNKNMFLWGDICIDKNDIAGQKIFSPGGSSFYCAKTLKGLGRQPLIVSPRGRDYNMEWLEGISVFPEKPLTDKTLVYYNNYDSKGKRTLYSKNRDCAFFVNPYSLPEEKIAKAKVIIVCPIDNNVRYSDLKKLRQRMSKEAVLACLPQGFFRRHKEDGKVYRGNWKEEKEIVPLLDIVFLSEEDGEDLDKKAVEWNKTGSIVVITRAEKGCSVFREGGRMDFPAFPVKKIVDPVGAGDIFSAAFISEWMINKNSEKAAVFANAAAAISLSSHALEMNISRVAVQRLIQS